MASGTSPGNTTNESQRAPSQSGRTHTHHFDKKLYNLDSLPTDVCEQVKLRRSDKRLMTKEEMVPFEPEDTDSTEDESGNGLNRHISHFILPDKVIMRDGNFFKLFAEKIPDK